MTGHLFYKRAALALMALFAALAMTLLPADGRKVSHAQTPSSMTLVSNTGQTPTSDRPVIGSSYDRAQEFTTGTNRDGYVLTSIDIMLNAAFGGATDLTMTLHSGSATGTKVADFDEPSSLTTGNATYTFIASAAVSLDASTSYWIVLEEPTTHRGGLVVTESDNQDTDSAAGWLIADAYEFRTASATGSFTVTTTGKSAIIDVKGYVGSIPTLVSNIEQGNDLVANVNTRRAQAFTTGFNLTGYTVTGVDIDYRDAEGHGLALSLCETNNDGTPNQSHQTCDIFTQPSFSAVGRLRFEAAASFTLDPATTYKVVFYSGSGDDVSLGGTSSIAEDASSLAGWSIRDKFHNQLADDSWATPGSVRSIRIDIEGTPKAPVANSPTSTDHTVETVVDTAHTFSAAHFNFMATTSGDTLSKVHILTLPNRGTLALSGTAVTAGDEITRAQLNAGNLKFTPDTGETGQGYASFLFRVEGSSLTSTNAYRMTIDVRTAESVPPALLTTNAAVLAADGKTLTLTYNEPMKETSTPGNSAFTVEATPAGGSEAEVALATTNGVSVSGSTVVLTLDKPIAHNDVSVKVTYDKPGSGAVIEDANGNEAPGFTDQSVTNNSLIPRVSIEALFPDASPVIANPAFKFTRSNTGVGSLRVALEMSQADNHMSSTLYLPQIAANNTTVETIGILGFVSNINTINTDSTVTLTVVGSDDHLPALAPNNSATVLIKLPPSGPTVKVGLQQNDYTIDEGIGQAEVAVAFTLGQGVAAPRYPFGGVGVAVLTDVYVPGLPPEERTTINVDYTHTTRNVFAAVGDWTSTPDGGYTYTGNVSVPIEDDDEHERDEKFRYYLDSTPGISNIVEFDDTRHIITIRDNDPLGVVDTMDTMMRVSSTPTGGYYDATDSIEFTVPFNGSVTVTGTPQLTFDLGGQTRRANYASGSGSDELVFSYTVTASDADDHDGISWGANALRLNGGTIKFTSADVNSRVDADLAHPARGPLPDHKVDTTKPSLVSANLDGTRLTMTFSEALNETAPANTVFTVKEGVGTGSNPTAVSISGSVVTLTLANAVASGQTVTVSYAKPATNPLKDLTGKEADGFVDNAVSVDPPPVFPNPTETFTVVENTTSGTVGMVTATDPENQTVIYSVEGTGADDFNHDFSLDSSTGEISVKSNATIDFETKSSYTVSIRATDTAGSNSAVEVTINVTNADDVGSVELSAGTPALSEPVTASVSDQDGSVTVQSWSWARGTTRTGSFSLISGEDTASYTPVDQDLGMFLRVSASYTDAFGSGKSAQGISLFAVSAIPLVNVAPEFEDASVTITIAEMISAGSDVGPPVMAEDRNGHTVTYAIRKRGDPDYDSLSRHADSFTIDSGTGQLKIKEQPDYERRHRYYVTVTATEPITTTDPIAATDPVGLSDSVNVIVLVTNLDDPGTVTLRSANPRVASEVSARLRDPDGGSSGVGWSWSRGGSPSGSFTDIEGSTGDLYVATQDDVGKYLRATATYGDSHGPGKSAHGTSSLPVGPSQAFPPVRPPVRIEILFDSSAYRAKEGGGVATVRLIAQRDHIQDVKETAQVTRRLAVPLTVSYGSGATASDHSVIPTEVIFQKGDSERTFRVIATPDADNDDGEWIDISLGMLPEEDSIYPGRRTAARVHLDDADDDLTPINVSFDSASYTASKGNEVTVTLQLDNPFVDRDSLNVSVYHELDDDGDYTLRYDRGGTTFAGYASPTTFSFRSGHTRSLFRIRCDHEADGAEDWTVSLRLSQASLPASTYVGSRGEATVTCTDPPMAEVRFGKGYYLTPEDGNAVRPSIVLSRALGREVTIPIVHSPQMGATAADYSISSTSVTFAAGETRKFISALATDDDDDDDDDDNEYVLLTFGTLPSGLTEAPGNHRHDLRPGWIFARKTSRLILVDNDAAPTTAMPPQKLRSVTVFFDEPSYSAGEGEFATVKVKLYSDPERRVVVPIVIKSRGPGAAAYTLTQDAIFEADSSAHTFEFTFRFTPIDNEDDDDEGVWVELGFGTLPEKVRAHPDKNTTRIDVVDNDYPQLTASFNSATYSVNEVHYSAPPAERRLSKTAVTVTLSADPEREVLIPIRLTSRGGAVGGDFLILGNAFRINKKDGDDHGTVLLRFRPSDPLSQTFDVKAWNDSDYDPGEWIDISFESMPEGVSAGSSARVNIVDDDPAPPTVRVDITVSQDAAEDGGPGIVEVSLNRSTDDVVVIPLVLSRLGGATASDHSQIPESLTFAPGATTMTFEVLATDDQDDDDGEWLEITIGQLPENFRVSNVAHTAVINLTDND